MSLKILIFAFCKFRHRQNYSYNLSNRPVFMQSHTYKFNISRDKAGTFDTCQRIYRQFMSVLSSALAALTVSAGYYANLSDV